VIHSALLSGRGVWRLVFAIAIVPLLTAVSVAGPPHPGLHAQALTASPPAALPARVVAPAGVLSLYADPASIAGEQIELYLVNRTTSAIRVPTQDNDVYAKLEISRKGAWERAQAHGFSDCGNSYHATDLRPGEFLRWSEYRPSHGKAATIRYKLYGGVAAVSSSMPGFYEEAELAAAGQDALAMRDGEIPTLRAALFGAAGPGDRAARDAAIQRLGELPAARAVPVVEQLIGSTVDDDEYSRAIRVLDHLAHARLEMLVSATLKQSPSPARDRLVRELRFMPAMTDPAVRADLLARAKDARSPDVRSILDTIGSYRSAEVDTLFASIIADPNYPEDLRIRAHYLRDEWFGDASVLVRVTAVGPYGAGHPAPVAVDVIIENRGSTPLRFAYTSPTEILTVYLTQASGREMTFLLPKKGVRFLTTAAQTPATRVDLAPLQRHTIRLGIMDYFDLSTRDRLSVWVSAKLPGRAAANLGGGAGINPR
jgi:hypothetical protein